MSPAEQIIEAMHEGQVISGDAAEYPNKRDGSQASSLAQSAPSPANLTPMDLIRVAVAQNLDIDKLTKLMDLRERFERDEAKKQFIVAMSAFKTHAIQVIKDKENTQYSSGKNKAMYVSLGRLIGTVTPFLSKNGLSARWDIDQTNGIKVTCIVTHAGGHSESVSMTCPPDKSGAKNPIQEIKSAITYAKGCTFESICGLAASDGNVDDDGNGGSYSNLDEQLEWIANASDVDELKKLYQQAYMEAQAVKDTNAMNAIRNAKDRRKKELQ